MNMDREDRAGQIPLPGFGEPAAAGGRVPLHGPERQAQAGQPAPTRSDGVRRVRRMSNWTLAALLVGTGAATVALAHNVLPAAVTAAGTASGATGVGTAAAQGAGGPQVSHSVATTSGSGVVVTTTTRTANGKVVVTHVRHAAAYHDN
jgi:hypothetical protein